MKKLSIWVIVMFSLIVLIMSCFFGWLIYSDYKNNYEIAQSQYYELICGQFVNNISESLKYGKTLDRFYGMDAVFQQMHAYLPENIPVVVLDREAEILYSSHAEIGASASALRNSAFRQALRGDGQEAGMIPYTASNGARLMLMPIFEEGGPAGGMVLVVSKDLYTETMDAKLLQFMLMAVIIAAIAWAIMFILYFAVGAARPTNLPANRMLVVRLMMLVAILALLTQGVSAYNEMQTQYRQILEECSANICKYFSSVIEQVNEKGVPYNEMEGVSEFLAARLTNVPMLWNVQVNEVLADSGVVLGRSSQSINTVTFTADATTLILRFELSEAYIRNALTQLFLTFLTTMIVAFVIIMEVSKLPEIYLMRRKKQPEEARGGISGLLRLAAFLVFMGNYMCIPYTAAIIRQGNASLFGLSVAMTASLPVTAEAFGMMLSLVLINRFARRIKTQKLLLGAMLLLVAGNLLCMTAPLALTLVLLRCLCGVGSALVSHSLQRIATGEGGDISGNLGAINAGLLAGITCGGSLGAIVTGMIGTHATFVGGVFFAMAFYVLLRLLAGKDSLQAQGERHGGGNVGILLKSSKVWRYILCAIIPLNIGIMFMVSFFPAYMSAMGQNSLTVSYGYIFNGLAGIYIGPLLLKTLARRLGTRKSLACMMGAAAAAMYILSLDTILIVAAMCSSTIMGIFDEFGGPVTNEGFLRLAARWDIRPVNALAFSSVIGNIAQMASPMLYSALIAGISQAQSSSSRLLPITVAALLNGVVILFTMKHLDNEIVTEGTGVNGRLD